MKYLTVMATAELGSTLELYHVNPASIVHLRDMGSYTVRMATNIVIDSPICFVTLFSGELYVSGVAEELIARMA